MKSVQINKNIRLNYIPMDKVKTTSVGVYIHRPLNKEDVSFNALLPMVLKHASKRFPTREDLAKHLDNLYGATMGAAVLKLGEDQVIYFDAEAISDKYTPDNERLLSELLKLLMSVVFEPKVSDDKFDRLIIEQEKIDAINRIDAFVNDKRQYASNRCQAETARGTNYALLRLGDRDTIKNITEKDLFDYYQSTITSSVIDIYICGTANFDEAEEVIASFIKDYDFIDAEVPKTEILSRKIKEINNVCERMDVTQGKLSLGFLTGISPTNQEFPALVVFNSIFGAGAHSKLFNNVREKLSLAYYASSSIEKYKGMLVVNAGIEFENYQKAYDEILLQLKEIQDGNISDHEFKSSVNTIINSYNSYYDDQRALATFYLTEAVSGRNMTISDIIHDIKKVTMQDVIDVSKKIELDTVYFLTGKEEN